MGSPGTPELIKSSSKLVREVSLLVEKKSSNGELDRLSRIRNCRLTQRSSRKQPDGTDVLHFSHCRVQDSPLVGRQDQQYAVSIHPRNGKENEKSAFDEEMCLQPTNKLSSTTLRDSKRRSLSNESYSGTSGEESDDGDYEMETWIQGLQLQKDNNRVKKVVCVLQTYQIASEKYSQAKALKLLKGKFKFLNNSKKLLGAVPGVDVGVFFYDKIELSIIGLHQDFHSGIDCFEHCGITIASSIVVSGFNVESTHGSDILIYPGYEGCFGYSSKKGKLCIDKKFEVGVLALKNSMEACTPVRVTYCLSNKESVDSHVNNSRMSAAYIYDGLYLVEKYWFVSSIDGFSTYNFQLRRKSEQPKFDIKELFISRPLKVRFGLRMEDISEGREKKPVSVVNIIDTDLPQSFTYITRTIYPSHYNLKSPHGCDCINGCSDSVVCACVRKNGGELPFNCEGGILKARPLVYECGPSCRCPPSCQNRVSQLGFEYRLEIFRTRTRGWGLRTLDKIPSGSFVCEYVGEMLEDAEAGMRWNDEYLFDIGRNYHDKSLWEGLPLIPSLNVSPSQQRNGGGFTIDAFIYGNLGRFVNHCCSPNMYAQNILYDHDDKRLPHIMFFASEDIFPYEELTYHYNYSIGSVSDSDGKTRKKACLCGSDECTGRLY